MTPGANRSLNRADGHRYVFSAAIILAIAATIIASLLLAGAGIYWATHASDAVSVERQARSAQHAMEMSVDELALQQETVAVWDLAAAALAVPRPSTSWIHENIGGWLYKMFKHDEVFVLDGLGRPLYASRDGEQVPLDRFASLGADFRKVLTGVRGNGELAGRHDRRRARTGPNSSVRTTTRATHESHLMLLDGRPAAVSAMLIEQVTPGWARQRHPRPVLLSVRYLDAGLLAELSARQLIGSPRFSRVAAHSPAESVVPLRTERGSHIGYLAWRPELPGTRILWKLVPVNLLVLTVFASLMIFLGRRLHGAARELSTAEANAHHLAFHDSLTGLPNRALFQLKLDELTTGDGEQKRFALLLLDIDEFKQINDTLGHDSGDALLRAFADRLKLAIRPDDVVARLGGDEFAVLLMGMCRADQINDFSARLLERLCEPIEHQGKLIHTRASIGVSRLDGTGGDHILKHADLALYAAKASGRGAFRLYDPAMWSAMKRRGEMLSVATAALEGEFVQPFYQAKVDLKSGEMVGFEALLRCCLPNREPKAAGCIAAAFEDSTLAVKLSDRMVDGVIRDILKWQAADLAFGHVAINAGLPELRRGDFTERLLGKLRAAGIAPTRIQVEVTESVLLGPAIGQVEDAFRQLAEAGIKLALDDFGTGFASLTHLKRFPIEIIKIDQSFIRDLHIDAEDAAIVRAVVGLGRALKIEVVAEGIETAMQRDFLSALGCSAGQGYLFGSALPAAQIAELLLQRARLARLAVA